MWKLWLDDQIHDKIPSRDVPSDHVGADSVESAILLVEANGPPAFMDLDHDLGNGSDSIVFLNWLAYRYRCDYPPAYRVHSMNTVGRDRIISFMESWKKFCDTIQED